MATPYLKTTWTTGDVITQAKARNWEDGIETLSAAVMAGFGASIVTQTTTGAEGAADPLPATPEGYVAFGANYVIPYYKKV